MVEAGYVLGFGCWLDRWVDSVRPSRTFRHQVITAIRTASMWLQDSSVLYLGYSVRP